MPPGTDDDSTYTITQFLPNPFVVNGVTVNGVLSADKGTVEYFGDDDGIAGKSAGDTKYYTLALSQADPGDYTFTVHFAHRRRRSSSTSISCRQARTCSASSARRMRIRRSL